MIRTLSLLATLSLIVLFPTTLVASETTKPGKVTGLMAIPYGSDAIYAAWDEPDSGGDPTKYLVQARSVDGGPIHRQWVDGDTLGHLFEGLDAGETYKVRVRAANSAGRGPLCVARVTLPTE